MRIKDAIHLANFNKKHGLPLVDRGKLITEFMLQEAFNTNWKNFKRFRNYNKENIYNLFEISSK